MLGPASVLPTKESGLGLQSLARELQEIAAATLRPSPFPNGPFERGGGHTVLVIPGLLAGDWTTTRLRDFLLALGYRVETADILVNAGPTRGIITKLESTISRLTEGDTSISLIGVSLGGIMARVLALRNPRQIRSVVTLCSPIQFPVTTPLQPLERMLAPLHEPEWVAQREQISGPMPVPVVAVYSEEDGIVDWRQCLVDGADDCENVRVTGSHMTICSNPEAQAAIALALARISAKAASPLAPAEPSRRAGAAHDR